MQSNRICFYLTMFFIYTSIESFESKHCENVHLILSKKSLQTHGFLQDAPPYYSMLQHILLNPEQSS